MIRLRSQNSVYPEIVIRILVFKVCVNVPSDVISVPVIVHLYFHVLYVKGVVKAEGAGNGL